MHIAHSTQLPVDCMIARIERQSRAGNSPRWTLFGFAGKAANEIVFFYACMYFKYILANGAANAIKWIDKYAVLYTYTYTYTHTHT